MATQVPPARKLIFVDGAQFRGAVSEELIQRIGATTNFINLFQYDSKQFYANGPYGNATMPQLGVDGLVFFEFTSLIIDVWAFVITAGSGTTELDVKYATGSGGGFTSIFSTTPKITAAAGNDAWTHLSSAPSGTTAPVLSTTTFAAGVALRMDILQAQTSGAQGTGIVVHYQPA